MVLSTLNGQKLETRRVIRAKNPWGFYPADHWWVGECPNGGYWAIDAPNGPSEKQKAVGPGFKCPYGKPGDGLWVREKFMTVAGSHEHPVHGEARKVKYLADGGLSDWLPVPKTHWDRPTTQLRRKVNQGRFMPYWASGIKLRITGIDVEPLQDITENGAKREGVHRIVRRIVLPNSCPPRYMELTHLSYFIDLWDRINAPRGFFWSENPWVWVVKYELISSGRLKSCQ